MATGRVTQNRTDPKSPKNRPETGNIYNRFWTGSRRTVKVSKKILTDPWNRWPKPARETTNR